LKTGVDSSAGKSTLVNLLCRLYDPSRGKLLINNRPIQHYDPKELRKHIAVLFQERCTTLIGYPSHFIAFLEGFSVRENVGIGQVDRIDDDEALFTALSSSGLADFIRELPKSLDTKLGRPADNELTRINSILGPNAKQRSTDDGFISPSGGQLQRLALARVFMRIREASLLILDEPSCNLDPEAEVELFKNIKRFRKGKTTIFITHRVNTVRIADRILVLEQGRVSEFGTHDELIKLPGGKYRYFDSLQRDALQGMP